MGSDRSILILRAVLDISAMQRRLFDEKRFEELFALQKEREALFAELAALAQPENLPTEARSLAGRILENDRVLSLNMESSLSEISGKLGRIGRGARVIKAYSSTAR